MAIQEKRSLLHWNYFLALESDMERLSRFIEFTDGNFSTYSIEIAHLLLAASSEVDVVSKQLCVLVDSVSKANNIEGYRAVLRRKFPELESSVVAIPRHGLEMRPWENWQRNETPDWWRDHNKVKHQRDEHFALANLKNVLNAMAGLFLIVLYYHRHTMDNDWIEPPPTLFTPPADLAKICGSWGGGIALFFKNEDR